MWGIIGWGYGNVRGQDRSKSQGCFLRWRQRNGLIHMPELWKNWPDVFNRSLSQGQEHSKPVQKKWTDLGKKRHEGFSLIVCGQIQKKMVKERLAKDREVNGMRWNGFIKPIYLSWVRQAASHLLSEGNGVNLTSLDLHCTFPMGSHGKFLRKGRGDFAQSINPWCKSSGAVRLEGSYQGSVKHHSADLAKCFCKWAWH